MASIAVIGKAKLYQAGLNRLLGVMPSLDIKEKHVNVYYPPDRLKTAQKAYKALVESPPGEVRVDVKSIIQPYYVKKLVPILAGSVLAGFLLGGN